MVLKLLCKDLRRYWLGLLGAVAAVYLFSAIQTLGTSGFITRDPNDLTGVYANYSFYLTLLSWSVLILGVIPAIVFLDKPRSSDSFYHTRPISTFELIAAKLLLLGVVGILLPAGADLWGNVRLGLPTQMLGSVFLLHLLARISVTLPCIAFAFSSESYGSYIVKLIIFLGFGSAFAGGVSSVYKAGRLQFSGATASITSTSIDSVLLIGAVLFIIASIIVIKRAVTSRFNASNIILFSTGLTVICLQAGALFYSGLKDFTRGFESTQYENAENVEVARTIEAVQLGRIREGSARSIGLKLAAPEGVKRIPLVIETATLNGEVIPPTAVLSTGFSDQEFLFLSGKELLDILSPSHNVERIEFSSLKAEGFNRYQGIELSQFEGTQSVTVIAKGYYGDYKYEKLFSLDEKTRFDHEYSSWFKTKYLASEDRVSERAWLPWFVSLNDTGSENLNAVLELRNNKRGELELEQLEVVAKKVGFLPYWPRPAFVERRWKGEPSLFDATKEENQVVTVIYGLKREKTQVGKLEINSKAVRLIRPLSR